MEEDDIFRYRDLGILRYSGLQKDDLSVPWLSASPGSASGECSVDIGDITMDKTDIYISFEK